MRQWAAAQAAKGKKAYTYFFSHIQTVNGQPSPQGATHTAEISFAWNNPKGQPTQTWNEVDLKLADQMSSYWVNFISKGDPNGAGLARWPEFKDLSKSRVMVFADTPQVEPAAPAPKTGVLCRGVSAPADGPDELAGVRYRFTGLPNTSIRATFT